MKHSREQVLTEVLFWSMIVAIVVGGYVLVKP